MEQLHLHVKDLAHLAPELTLVISAVLLSLLDMMLPKRTSRSVLGWLAIVGIAVSAAFVANKLNISKPVVLLGGSYRIDDFANVFKLIFLAGTGLIVFMSIGSVRRDDIPHVGEYYYLLLPAVLGAMVMCSSGDLITLFVGLELLSITSYILVGMRKHKLRSSEGAFKYVVMGGISSAFILYGMSFLYGLSGSTNLMMIKSTLSASYESYTALIYVSFFLLLAGLGFKIAAAPFHTWAPDVYQGAPTPVTAFLAVVSKGAALALLFRIVYNVYFGIGLTSVKATPIHDDVLFSVGVLAAITMIVGNAMALRQKNMKRLLALSGVANAGYLMVPISTNFNLTHYANFEEVIFYLIAYMFMTIGALAVFMAVSEAAGHEEMSGFSGLYYRAPFTAVAMIIFVLSLAGLPVTGGFFGKLYIMLGTLQVQMYWLAAVMIATSVVSFYYYFGIIRQMFMRRTDVADEIELPAPLGITIWLCAIATLVLGFFPQWVIAYVENIFSITKDLFAQ